MKLLKILDKIKNNSLYKLTEDIINNIFKTKLTDINLYNNFLNELSHNTSINNIILDDIILDNPQIIDIINSLKYNDTFKKITIFFIIDHYGYNYNYIYKLLDLKNYFFIIYNSNPYLIYNDNFKNFISNVLIFKYINIKDKFKNNNNFLKIYSKFLDDNTNNQTINKQYLNNVINLIKKCITENIDNNDDIEYIIKNCNIINLYMPKTNITQNISNLLKDNNTIQTLTIKINNFNQDIDQNGIYSFLKYNNTIQKLCCYNIKDNNINLLIDNLNDNVNNNITKIKLNFNLKDNFLNKDNVNIFINYLKNNNTIKILKLYNFKNINDLSEVFKYNTSINKLIIYSAYLNSCMNNINTFINSLINNKTLKYLSINKNKITTNDYNNKQLSINDIYIINNLLQYNTTLETLKLCNCNLFTYNNALISLKYNTTLTTLDLSNNNIDNIKNISESLLSNTSLTKLDLSSNEIEDINYLSTVLKQNTNLQKLYLQNNKLNITNEFIESLKNNTTLYKLSYEIKDEEDFIDLCNSLKFNNYLSNLSIYAQSYTDYIIDKNEVKPILNNLLDYNNKLVEIQFYSIENENDYFCC